MVAATCFRVMVLPFLTAFFSVVTVLAIIVATNLMAAAALTRIVGAFPFGPSLRGSEANTYGRFIRSATKFTPTSHASQKHVALVPARRNIVHSGHDAIRTELRPSLPFL
jgi:hypothetical protein